MISEIGFVFLTLTLVISSFSFAQLIYSHFILFPAIPTTLQFESLASWPTNCPTAPEAAETTTVSPGIGLQISKIKEQNSELLDGYLA